jgi:Ran GTPase-activating protein (RanGAP) involved in mRNA processing and transport
VSRKRAKNSNLDVAIVDISPSRPWDNLVDHLFKEARQLRIRVKDQKLSLEEFNKLNYALPKCTELSLSNIFCSCSSADVEVSLASLNSPNEITELDISFNAIGVAINSLLPLVGKLKSIDLTNSGIETEQMNLLLSCLPHDLSSLKCSRNNFTEHILLEPFVKLTVLDLSSNRIPKKELNALILFISTLKSPKSINISDNGGNDLDDDAIFTFTRSLTNWTGLEELGIGDIGLSSKQAEWIFLSLPKSLKEMNFSYSCLEQLNRSFLKVFKNLGSLLRLNLAGNHLSKDIKEELMSGLTGCILDFGTDSDPEEEDEDNEENEEVDQEENI